MTREFETIETMLAELHARENLHIRLVVGKYGRCDMFRLNSWVDYVGRRIGLLSTSGQETIAALRVLDEAVRTDATTVFRGDNIWLAVGNKREGGAARVERLAVPLYERRLIEQERILRGEIKRGHKAFGFYPLEGGA